MAGRKPIHKTDSRVKALLELLEDGNYINVACAYAGLGQSTVHMWMERGQKERERIDNGELPIAREQRFVELLELIEKARATAVARSVKVIRTAGETGQWQAAAWWLERTMPKEFGRQTRTEVTGNVSVDVSVESVNTKIAELMAEVVVEAESE